MNALVKTNGRELGATVRTMQDQFALALPEHVSPERFVRVVVTAINSNPDLQKCDRDSVLGAAMKCAQDGLLPDGREAALVAYGNKAQYLPMIAGVLTKVRRSGELLTIGAHIVYEHDTFTYTLGDEEKLIHEPHLRGPRGKAIAAYAIAKTKDGGIYREIMSVEQIERVRQVSRAKNNGPWVAWWDEMARKTVLRRLSKRLPMSTDLLQVFARDDDHYDLKASEAAGEAKIRRLHADFDESSNVIDITPQAVPDAPEAEGVAEATFSGEEAQASAQMQREPEEDSFPGDAKPKPDLPAGVKTGSDLLREQEQARALEDLPERALTAWTRLMDAMDAADSMDALDEVWKAHGELRAQLAVHAKGRLDALQAHYNGRLEVLS